MENIKNISLFILTASIVVYVSNLLESKYLIDFLKENLITILIALLAINTTTSSVVMTKLRDISDIKKINFNLTIKELKHSFTEQILFIIFSIFILIALSSNIILELSENMETILNVLLITTFIASLYNLFDTANSIFVILDFENLK